MDCYLWPVPSPLQVSGSGGLISTYLRPGKSHLISTSLNGGAQRVHHYVVLVVYGMLRFSSGHRIFRQVRSLCMGGHANSIMIVSSRGGCLGCAARAPLGMHFPPCRRAQGLSSSLPASAGIMVPCSRRSKDISYIYSPYHLPRPILTTILHNDVEETPGNVLARAALEVQKGSRQLHPLWTGRFRSLGTRTGPFAGSCWPLMHDNLRG